MVSGLPLLLLFPGMRILLGTTEICRQLYDLADGFRALGHTADVLIYWPNPFCPELEYKGPRPFKTPFTPRFNQIRNPLVRVFRGLINRGYAKLWIPYLLCAYDLYVFQFGSSLLPKNRDFRYLKLLRKKIVSIFVGSDIRHESAAVPHLSRFGIELPRAWYSTEPLDTVLLRLRLAERYSDVIFAQPAYDQLMVRPYHHFFVHINLSLYTHWIPDHRVPVVVHAPSRSAGKGTAQIMQALSRLRAEGVRFGLRLLEHRPNWEVRAALVDADVAIDQLFYPTNAGFATEAMACGCAVAGGNRPDFMPIPPNRPMIHIDPHTVYPQLKRLLTDRSLRLRLAHASRPFVEQYHDHVKVARHILACLSGSVPPDYVPTYYVQHYSPPDEEAISQEVRRLTARLVRRWHG